LSHPATAVSDSQTPRRQIVLLGLPLLIGALSASLSGTVDTAMMGHYGPDDLAAVSSASALFDILSGIVLASVTGHQILAARFAGRQDPAGIRQSLRSSAWFCGGIAVVLTAACVFAGGWLTGLVAGGDARLHHIGAGYLAARGPSLLLLVPFALLAAIFNAYKKPRYAMIAGIVVNGVNLVLDLLLIYGPGSFPRLGAAGNGLATTLSWAVGVGCLLVAARRFGLTDLLRRPALHTAVDFITSIPKLGWPAIVSTGLDYLSVALFFVIIGGIGGAALGGGRIAFEVMVLVFGVASAFAAASRILVGRALGTGRTDQARVFWRTGQIMLLIPAAVAGAVMAVFPTPIARLFTSFTPVIHSASGALVLVGVSLPLLAWTLGNVSVLRALGYTNWDMYANLVASLFIQLPVGWLFADVAGLGVSGAYIGVLCYWLVRAAITELLARKSVARKLATETVDGRLSTARAT
jgi:MATE family multidrug resistance protein